MANSRLISLCLRSNIANYKLMIYTTNNNYCVIINNETERISFYTTERQVQLIAIPITSGYNKKLCFVLDSEACQCCCINLLLNFEGQTPTEDVFYTFYLTDRVYGLPIDGTLQLNKV